MFSIYQIINGVNQESYIGFTTKSAQIRWKRHQYLAKYGSSGYFHCAIRKYGVGAFRLEILEEGWDPKIGKDVREPYWISVLKPQYNMTAGGNGSPGHIVTENTRNKMRKPKELSHRKHISDALIGNNHGSGHVVSDSFKKEQSDKMLGNQYWKKRKVRNTSIKKFGL